jgi:hypothetical protein
MGQTPSDYDCLFRNLGLNWGDGMHHAQRHHLVILNLLNEVWGIG